MTRHALLALVGRTSHLRLALALLLVLGLGGLAGCDTTPRASRNAVQFYYSGDFKQAEDHVRPVAQKKDEHFVLNNLRLGSAALATGDLDTANQAFYEAYKVINSVNTNDPDRKFAALVVYEGFKVWKGEPYERAMADYYLGLTALLDHKYDDARACFQSSVFNLPVYDDQSKDDPKVVRQDRSSFALGYLLVGFCNLRMGNAGYAQDNFKIATEIDPRLSGLVRDLQRPEVNTIMVVDAGRGPRRAAKGWYNEESAFGPSPAQMGPIAGIAASVDGRVVNSPGAVYHTVDTLALAQDRKWQDFDTVRKVKAVIGTGAMAAGAGVTADGAQRHDTGTELAGVGIMALGAALAASSQADTRYWEMLPRTVYIVPAYIPPGQHTFQVNAGGTLSPPLTTTINPSAAAAHDNILYFRLLPTGPEFDVDARSRR